MQLTIGAVLETTLALSAVLKDLEEHVKAVEKAREQLDDLIGHRDDSIRYAAGKGIGYPLLGRLTHLSRNRLWTIVNGGRGAVD